MKYLLKLCVFLIPVFFSVTLSGQFGYGLTGTIDLYQRYKNPPDVQAESPYAGSALLNLGLGPKIWLGGYKFSVSLESQAVVGFFALSTSEYKGMGSLAIPIMAKLNFKGITGFEKEISQGFNVGGGIQYNLTELYGVTDKFAGKGLQRLFFPTYVAHVGYGFGLSGFTTQGFIRYGFHPDETQRSLNVGIQFDLNRPMLKKISSPESEL